jgi:hypothetical protein
MNLTEITKDGLVINYNTNENDCVEYLRSVAMEIRRKSRVEFLLPDDVMALCDSDHKSELVTLGAYRICRMQIPELIKSINNHGGVMFTAKNN